MNTHRNSSKVFKQGKINSFLTTLMMLFGFVLVTLQIKVLGLELYGLLVLMLSIFSSINLFNVGFGAATIDSFSKYGEDKSIFWSLVVAIIIVMLLISSTVFFVASFFFEGLFLLIGVANNQLDITGFYGLSLIAISKLLGMIISSYWMAAVDFFKLKTFSFVNTYISGVLIVLIYLSDFSFGDSLMYAGICNFIFVTLVIVLTIPNETDITLSKAKKEFKNFFINGFQFQGIAIVGSISNPIINILINTTFGLQSVSFFDICMKLLRSGRQILVSFSDPIFGEITRLGNNKQSLEMHKIVKNNMRLMVILSIVYSISAIYLSYYFLSIWVGIAIAKETFEIVNIISIGYAFNIATSGIYYRCIAIKRSRTYAFYHELILMTMSIIPFLLPIGSLVEYSIYYSFAYILGGAYILLVFYKRLKVV